MNGGFHIPLFTVRRATRWAPGGWRRWLRQVEHGLAFIGFLLLVYYAGFNLSQVTSGSMAPTLKGEAWGRGDRVLAETLSYRLRTPHRWEIVMFRTAEGLQVMKRVVGLPGESVAVRDHQIWINDGLAKPPIPVRYFADGCLANGRAMPCGRGYFVMGDDSQDSDDSRYHGPLEPEKILGRAWLIVSPWSRLGFVTP